MGNEGFDARLDLVPYDPGVYLMKDASGSVIYVGKAKKLRNRLNSYFGGGTITIPKVAAMVSHVADFEYIVVGSESEALLLEANLIKRYRPMYNILLRDDKGYPYVCITLNEEYPRVYKAFRPDPKLREEGARYFGPYMNSDLYHTLRAVEEIFPLKRCAKKLPRDIGKERPCLNSHIGKCMAPCSGEVSSGEYRRMIDQIVLFFEGKFKGIESEMEQKMNDASARLDFEEASRYRDRLFALRNIKKEQKVFMEIDRDADAIGLYSQAGETCIRKMELREGRIVGSSTYFVKGTADDAPEIVTGFVTQYYSGANIPGIVLLPEGLFGDISEFREEETIGFLERYLSDLAGRKISVRIPVRGELHDLIVMAGRNAREMMVRRVLRGGGAGADPSAALRILEKMAGLSEGYISRVESYDISNLGNDDICAGMVVFRDGRPERASYRLFRMKTVGTQDDFASMRETLTRRLAHNKDDGFEYPSMILVDGGRGQLSAVKSVVDSMAPGSGIVLAGMVKNDRHRTSGILFEDGTFVKLEGEDDDGKIALLRFLSAVQNEVHRFAVTYQRKLSSGRNLRYKLENIKGIGPAKRKALLRAFGSIKKISEATAAELCAVKGISPADAEAVLDYLNGRDE